jgi:chromosome segregation ATPase
LKKEGGKMMDEILQQILHELRDLKSDVSGLKSDVSSLKSDVSGLKSDVSSLKSDVSSLKAGQERIETKVDNLALELRSNFKFTNDKLEEHKSIFTVVSNEIKGIKGDIEFLSGKSGKHDTEINHIMNMLRG